MGMHVLVPATKRRTRQGKLKKKFVSQAYIAIDLWQFNILHQCYAHFISICDVCMNPRILHTVFIYVYVQ